ncbi:VOC family protein [Pseudactinotalea sp.]|uniref:VOC family protein n=1 Tax=Pseudactinotalea sp. TaxID=1926260 RepID=UPI003B3BD9D6
MASILNPYISLRDNAREALAFYAGVFGGEPSIMTFGDSGFAADAGGDPVEAAKIMHGYLATPAGFHLMVADTPASMEHSSGGNISISLSGDDEAELTGYWTKLSEGATIVEPLTQAPWGDRFGILTDSFGVGWMVNITAAAA